MTKSYRIAVLPGDGIGPEVMEATVAVMRQAAEAAGIGLAFEYAPIGHAAIEAVGDPLPEATLEACRRADAILLGAVGDPRYDLNPSLPVRPEQGLLKLRKSLGLYANIRPIKLFDELLDASSLKPEVLRGADIVFFRELTGGIYFGQPRERRENGQVAVDTMVYSKAEVRRIAVKAFEAARLRRKQLCSVDKANVLESSRLWRETVQEIALEYPDVAVTHMFIDNAAMQLIRNPRQFDVVLTGNMFGDILTDEASQIVGSLGMLPSASVGDSVGLYEPIHGSAPDIAGKGVANPLASILSGALLFESSFGLKDVADGIVAGVERFLKEGWRTPDTAEAGTPKDRVLGTQAVTEKLCAYLREGVAC
jgi:3-isopropylmalate dehydrogenase